MKKRELAEGEEKVLEKQTKEKEEEALKRKDVVLHSSATSMVIFGRGGQLAPLGS